MRNRSLGCLLTVLAVYGTTGALTWGQAANNIAQPSHKILTNATTGPTGLAPATVRKAYGFDQITNTGSGQTIAIIAAYDNPNVEADLGKFVSSYKLTACTTANGCFKKIYSTGVKPNTEPNWALEMSLDVQWAHAMSPGAKILLVEAPTAAFTDLLAAVDVAVSNGATVVSMSFGGSEWSAELNYDFHFQKTQVTFLASSGDTGTGVQYPAASPYVLSVGGTTLTLASGAYGSETAWAGSGGGISGYQKEPTYQAALPIANDPNSMRGVPDVAYAADPNSGFSVYNSVPVNGTSGWFKVGGTSAGTPQWASLFAIVNSSRVAAKKLTLTNALGAVYTASKTVSNFHDVKSGTNGACGSPCSAVAGYDYVTGLGSPQVKYLVPALVALP